MKNYRRTIILTLSIAVYTVPTLLLAADPEFIPLVGIPFVEPNSQSTGEYVEALYKLSIGLAAFLAVIKIIFAGVQYMLSEIVTDKGKAKQDIQGALLGLLIIVGAVTLLNEINPDLKKLDFIENAEPYGRVVQHPNAEINNRYDTSNDWKENDPNFTINPLSDCPDNNSCQLLFVSNPEALSENSNDLRTYCTSTLEGKFAVGINTSFSPLCTGLTCYSYHGVCYNKN